MGSSRNKIQLPKRRSRTSEYTNSKGTRAMPKYFVSGQAAMSSELASKYPGLNGSRPLIQNKIAATQRASIMVSHITLVLETMKAGVKSVAAAAIHADWVNLRAR